MDRSRDGQMHTHLPKCWQLPQLLWAQKQVLAARRVARGFGITEVGGHQGQSPWTGSHLARLGGSLILPRAQLGLMAVVTCATLTVTTGSVCRLLTGLEAGTGQVPGAFTP